MARHDPIDKALLIADLTQSWSDVGGGVRTYLRHKRSHILDHTPHRHLMIVPGKRDAVEVEKGGRAITAYVASPKVPGSPHYRLLLRNRAVRSLLSEYLPDLIECQDAYNLPWVVIGHGKRHPGTALVAAYMTDFPTVYVDRPFSKWLGRTAGGCYQPHLLCLLWAAVPAVRRSFRAERKWRCGAAPLARREGYGGRPAWRRIGPVLAGQAGLAPA